MTTLATDPHVLYHCLFDLLRFDKDTKPFQFLITHHDCAGDRNGSEQSQFCNIWYYLCVEIFTHRRTLTKDTDNLRLWFPIVDGQNVTDSYLVFFYENLGITAEKTLDRTWKALSPSPVSYFLRKGMTLQKCKENAKQCGKVIRLFYLFQDGEEDCLLDQWKKNLDTNYMGHRMIHMTLAYHLLRCFCLWMHACACLQQPTEELQNLAANDLITLMSIYEEQLKPVFTEYKGGIYATWLNYAQILNNSAGVEIIIIKAERQTAMDEILLASICYSYLLQKNKHPFQWIETQEAKRISESANEIEGVETKNYSDMYSKLNAVEPIGEVQPGLFNGPLKDCSEKVEFLSL